jgi:putative transposase
MVISFKSAHVAQEIMLTCVRWYVAYPPSDRPLEERRQARGVLVDHSTIKRWVLKYSPPLAAAFHRRKRLVWLSWRMDDTDIRIRGHWRDLDQAVAQAGHTIDCLITAPRDRAAALRFLVEAIRSNGGPDTITVDGREANASAMRGDHEAHGTSASGRCALSIMWWSETIGRSSASRIRCGGSNLSRPHGARWLARAHAHVAQRPVHCWGCAGFDSSRTGLCAGGVVTMTGGPPSSRLNNGDRFES